jgi:GNAT superfamily N-acetyltransferase
MLDRIELVESFSDNEQLVNLYEAVALGHRSPQQIITAFHNSKYTIFALKNDRLIGAGRAFGDEVDCAVICDLAVHPEFQGIGIGDKILSTLKERVKHHLRIILYAKPGKEDFYSRRGFVKMKTAMITSSLLSLEIGRETGFTE